MPVEMNSNQRKRIDMLLDGLIQRDDETPPAITSICEDLTKGMTLQQKNPMHQFAFGVPISPDRLASEAQRARAFNKDSGQVAALDALGLWARSQMQLSRSARMLAEAAGEFHEVCSRLSMNPVEKLAFWNEITSDPYSVSSAPSAPETSETPDPCPSSSAVRPKP